MEQRTKEWFIARKGKFTASEIYNLLVSSKKKDELFGETAISYIKEKASEYLMNDDVFSEIQDFNFSNAATRWGEAYESEARNLYMEMTGERVYETGFVQHTKYSGGSPDGVNEDGKGLIEIKCPFNSSKHIDFMMMEKSDDLLKLSKQYYYQCQANMMFCQMEYLDFISYDPRLSPLLRMKILRIPARKEDFDVISHRIEIAESILDEIVQRVTKIGIDQLNRYKSL